jgi:hypothetical protein
VTDDPQGTLYPAKHKRVGVGLAWSAAFTIVWWVLLLGPPPTRILFSPLRYTGHDMTYRPSAFVSVGLLFLLIWLTVSSVGRFVRDFEWPGILAAALVLPWIGGIALWTGCVLFDAVSDGKLEESLRPGNIGSMILIGLGGTAATLMSLWGPVVFAAMVVSLSGLRWILLRNPLGASETRVSSPTTE